MSSSSSSSPFSEISVEELATRLVSEAEQLQLIDVREPQELAIASLPGFQNFPLSQYQQWGEQIHSQLDPQQETIVLCHHGMRSANMCQWLVSQGFTAVKNVTGGIHAYSIRVDPSVPQY